MKTSTDLPYSIFFVLGYFLLDSFAFQFALCLLVVFICELAVGIAAAVYKGDFEMVLKETLRNSMNNYYDKKADRVAWDNVQVKVRQNEKIDTKVTLEL